MQYNILYYDVVTAYVVYYILCIYYTKYVLLLLASRVVMHIIVLLCRWIKYYELILYVVSKFL